MKICKEKLHFHQHNNIIYASLFEVAALKLLTR